MYKHLFKRFLAEHADTLDFAAHSHHYWPDATRDAMLRYWDDAAKMVGDKWNHVFGTVVPEAQQNVAKCLGLPHPEQIVFGPSTHEFVCRVLSCFPVDRPIRLLTTDSEFYSFRRQMLRMAEDNVVEPTIIETEPIDTFEPRFAKAIGSQEFDLIYVSHTFFNSGYVIQDLDAILDRVDFDRTQVMIDAYHSFCALPVSYMKYGDRMFVTSGGYKYAMGGEGTCFLSVPKNTQLRPSNTGWFAAFGSLESGQTGGVQYGAGGQRFAGATFDPTGTYRYNAAMQALEDEGVSIADVHQHVQSLQARFLTHLADAKHQHLRRNRLLYDEARTQHGHFFTFELESADATAQFAKQLKSAGVEIDYRGSRIRFGFGLYQDISDVDALFERLPA
jgi:selenocysteine lyase/cysteine desulfurase